MDTAHCRDSDGRRVDQETEPVLSASMKRWGSDWFRTASAGGERSNAEVSTTPAIAAKRQPRDHRIDLVRGLALVMIFINHMPGNWLGHWTSRNFGFSDAAELFVLLAGYAAALAFYPLAAAHRFHDVVARAFRRAGTLYGAHLVTTCAAMVLFWAYLSITGPSTERDLIGITPLLADPGDGLSALLFGGLQLSYFNILPLYIVLLAALPGLLWLAQRDIRLLLAASTACYLATNAGGLALPASEAWEGWFFNPLAWQSVFVAGLWLGIARLMGWTVGYSRVLYGSALGVVVFAAVWMILGGGDMVGAGLVPEWVGSLQKPNLPLMRLLHALALAYVVGQSRVWAWMAKVPSDFVLTRMGRHSLPVFIAGSLLSMTGWIVMTESGGGFAVETAVASVGVLAMALQAVWLEHETRPSAILTALSRAVQRGSVSSAKLA